MTRKEKLLKARELAKETGKKVLVRGGKVEVWDGETEERGDILVYFKEET